ncbi:MAG: hypothetical protein HY928_08710 [Elusimicrobia bacterium]|nr:hypothetical protein [Elusimicrobiota bacterium]
MPTALGAALLLAVVGVVRAGATIGLSSQFVNVAMENLEPGKSYNLLELRGLPYTVKNRGDGPVEVLVEITPPTTQECLAPYEPMPDASWMSVSPSRLRLDAGEPGFAALTIDVPNDPKFVGRHFQGQVWAHTLGTGLLAAGVRSNIRFSIGKGPETLEAEAHEKQMVALNYELWPAALYVTKARAGAYEPAKEEGRQFVLTNRSEEPLELVATAVAWERMGLPAGYEAPKDLSWVKIEPATVKVDPISLERVRLKLDIPEQYKGKKLAFLIQLSLPIGTVVNRTNRVLVEVAP